jgi:hypothetical protein
MADHGEPVLGSVELARDHVLDIGVKRSLRAEDELAQRRNVGRCFLASLESFGPVVWIRPTALSVKSDALITRAQGLACRLAVTCSRYCSC